MLRERQVGDPPFAPAGHLRVTVGDHADDRQRLRRLLRFAGGAAPLEDNLAPDRIVLIKELARRIMRANP